MSQGSLAEARCIAQSLLLSCQGIVVTTGCPIFARPFPVSGNLVAVLTERTDAMVVRPLFTEPIVHLVALEAVGMREARSMGTHQARAQRPGILIETGILDPLVVSAALHKVKMLNEEEPALHLF